MDVRLFLAIVLLSQALSFTTGEESRESVAAACPEKFQCGDLSFMFPFTNSMSYNCGLSVVDCAVESYPRIALSYPPEQWFTPESIDNSTVKLKDPYLQDLLANRSCDAFHHGIHLPNSPSISFTVLNNITLFRCDGNKTSEMDQKKLNDSFRGYGYFGECDDYTLYYQPPNSLSPTIPIGTINELCTVINLPMNKSFSPDSKSDVPEVFRLSAAEFDLQWHVSEQCHECHHRGGVCQTEWLLGPPCVNAEYSLGTGKKKFGVILGIGAAGGGMVLLACFLICIYKFKSSSHGSVLMLRMKSRNDQNLKTFIRQHESLAPKRYPYSDIKKITNLFKDELGQGGYGTVYRGKLLDGPLVAVKILNVANGNDEDFINEVLSISRTSHVNVVKLLGFCVEGKKRALVYEYMPNGSLEKYIHDRENSKIYGQLGMDKLYQISLGVARGLEYLHRGCNTRILHFDIKPHNILLDEDFCPKISDFGLAKQCANKDSAVSILGARGTIGYIAPELISRCFGVVSYKSDVYSYGMMILEIVGQRKNVSVETSNASEIYFPHWAYQHLVVNKDLRMKGALTLEEDEIAKKLLLVGLWCIQNDPSHRPTMSKVIEMLEGSLEAIEFPPKPFFGSPSTSPQSSFNGLSEITSTLLTSESGQNHPCSWSC